METNWVGVASGLEKYKWIMEKFGEIDVSADREFKKKFNGFYRIRQRTPEFYDVFYKKLQDSKDGKCPTFGDVLEYFWRRLNRLEASFSSKLVATVNPDLPVWDAEVLRNLEIKKPLSTDKNRLKKTIEIYDEIIVWYANYLKNRNGQIQLEEFNKRFPNSGLSDLKKIDLILWQTRRLKKRRN